MKSDYMKRNPRELLHAIIAAVAVIGGLLVIVIPNISLQWGVFVLFLLVIALSTPSKKILKSCPSCGSFKKQKHQLMPLDITPYSKPLNGTTTLTKGESETFEQGWKGVLETVITCENFSRERVSKLTEFVPRKQAPSLADAEMILKQKFNIN